MKQTHKDITASMEDYLEAIFILARQNNVARVRDIAAHMKVGMPAVSAALKTLAGKQLVNYDPYQLVTLTPRGTELAEQVSRRHDDLQRFLMDTLGLDAPTAEANACRMEHAIDEAVLDRLRLFGEFVAAHPRDGQSWGEAFQKHCRKGSSRTTAASQNNKTGKRRY
ncbi:MAG: metal-dependent transcriptional regulator [Planctomycetaceae bacterium]|nr:MAG: metal-dependent transcriptional regulator [Planctomycetaceae bacterium]